MIPEKNFCLIGLPESGKTSFAAALWHTVESKELSNSLHIEALPVNRQYLQLIRDAWLKYEDVNRTSQEKIPLIELAIHDSETDLRGSFAFPDVKGEVFQHLFKEREVITTYHEILIKADGILLFIGNKIRKPVMISEYQDILEDGTKIEPAPWTHENAPTQVVLVDLLQAISAWLKKPFKIAVVISAWDKQITVSKIEGKIINPDSWLHEQLPLLYQFLVANRQIFNLKVFGISAQGGDYATEKDVLYKFDSPSERIKVQQGSDIEILNDITLPIKWLLQK